MRALYIKLIRDLTRLWAHALAIVLVVGGNRASSIAARCIRRSGALSRAIARSASGLLLSPIVGAAAMSFSSVSVVGNSLRLQFARL